MIEVASWPSDLTQWDPRKQPFYLEVFGETSPRVDLAYGETPAAGTPDGAPPVAAPGAPTYEYWWTIGHPGRSSEMRHWWDALGLAPNQEDLWDNLEDPAARVYLYFPLSGGWRIKELAAAVKYLSPALPGETVGDKIAKDWQDVAPIVSGVSALASLAPVPGVAAVASTLSTIARMQINTVPQTDGFAWSIAKVTFGSPLGVMQGVMWRLPKRMFIELGGRLTGSLALSFIPSQVQQPDAVRMGLPVLQPRAILAHACVGATTKQVWVPGESEFLRLQVAPTLPSE
jgi:hypothetical protein